MSERLSGIWAFVQVVEAGNFAAAAERLRVTRSAIAKSIARLEKRLGTRLFHRTTRSQALTEDGQAYYERCIRALAELDAGEAALEAGRREPSGRLRVTAPVLFGRHCVAPVLLELARRHPALEIEMSFTDRVVDVVEERFDLAVRIGPLQDSTTLSVRRLGEMRMAVCASSDYVARRGTPRRVEDLAGHDAIVYRDLPWPLRDHDNRIVEARLKSRFHFDDLEAIADAAVAGAGLAWLPCWLTSARVRAGELQLVMDSSRTLAGEIHAVWPQSRYLPSRTRVAIDALVALIPASMAQPGAPKAARRRSRKTAGDGGSARRVTGIRKAAGLT
ncbi:MAG: bacterial regulatory helix-turn-helix, lysR family protein [Verrucomicrobia bacterium]|nr:bacterial regulatory helix-turn-helix, lysR family protein [Verrucomicrobiota bacterium]